VVGGGGGGGRRSAPVPAMASSPSLPPPLFPPTSHGHECESGCTGSYCMPMGVVIHVLGSVGINIGQNLQALALEQLEESAKAENGLERKPWKSKLWVAGMAIFAIASIITFGALALASASVLVPLESVQFIVNLLFGKFVRKKVVTPRMIVGTVILIGGIACVVAFGPKEGGCFDVGELRAFWAKPAWIAYTVVTFAIAGVMYILWRKLAAARKANVTLIPHAHLAEPLAFTMSAALAGGGQMIVHTKMLAELIELSTSGDLALADGLFWVEVLLTALFGGYWLYRLSQCLGMYDTLLIIPLMQTAFIIFGAIAAGIFYHEFMALPEGPAGYGGVGLYSLGILMTVLGLAFLAPVPSSSVTSKVDGGVDTRMQKEQAL